MLEAKLVVVGGEAKQTEVRLKVLPTIIGRAREATLTLPHPLVSRKHCEILEENGRLYVKDLDSLNGTYVNNERIDGQQQLAPEQLLTLGNVTFRAVYEPATSGLADACQSEPLDELAEPATPKLADTLQVEPVDTLRADQPVVIPASILPDQLVDSQSDPLLPDFEPVDADDPKPVVAQRDIKTAPGVRSAGQETVHEKSDQRQSDQDRSELSASDTGEILADLQSGDTEPETTGSSDILIDDAELGTGPEKSISESAIGDLPTGRKQPDFSVEFGVHDAEKVAIEQVEAVEIDLGDSGSKNPDESSSKLDDFVRKLPK